MHYLKNTLILCIVALLTFSSCNKDDDEPSTNNVIQQGKWKVSLFVDSGTDKISYFSGYEFTFTDNGVVTAVKAGSPTVTGSWSTRTEDDQNKMIFNFGSTLMFNDLNEDWRVVERNTSRIRLEHTSGGSGGTDLLTLEKI